MSVARKGAASMVQERCFVESKVIFCLSVKGGAG